jgi:hypothetical protein
MDGYIAETCGTWALKWTETEFAKIVVAEQFNPDVMPLPGIIIVSYNREASGDDAKFGDGKYHMSFTYEYQIIVCAGFETDARAKRFGQAASASLLDEFRNNIDSFCELSASNGEGILRFEMEENELYVRGLAAQPISGVYTGCCVVDLTVYTEI